MWIVSPRDGDGRHLVSCLVFGRQRSQGRQAKCDTDGREYLKKKSDTNRCQEDIKMLDTIHY